MPRKTYTIDNNGGRRNRGRRKGKRPLTPTGRWRDGSNISGMCGNPSRNLIGNTMMHSYTVSIPSEQHRDDSTGEFWTW